MLALLGGAFVGGVLIFSGNWGSALWIAVPLSCGVLVGYGTSISTGVKVALVFCIGLSLIFGLMSFSLAGVFCGVVLAGIGLGPLVIGALAGAALRYRLQMSDFSQRDHFPIWLVLLLPLIWGLIEGPPSPSATIQTVSTARVVQFPIQKCWDALMFYEDVQHQAPWIIRTGLATPVSSEGVLTGIGDQRTCHYTTGRIVKQVTAFDPPNHLSFDVIEQTDVYEHDAQLIGGSFEFIRVDENTTRILLTTTYRPRLSPRFAWEPFERFAVRGLHNHVLEGIERAVGQGGLEYPVVTPGEAHDDHGG